MQTRRHAWADFHETSPEGRWCKARVLIGGRKHTAASIPCRAVARTHCHCFGNGIAVHDASGVVGRYPHLPYQGRYPRVGGALALVTPSLSLPLLRILLYCARGTFALYITVRAQVPRNEKKSLPHRSVCYVVVPLNICEEILGKSWPLSCCAYLRLRSFDTQALLHFDYPSFWFLAFARTRFGRSTGLFVHFLIYLFQGRSFQDAFGKWWIPKRSIPSRAADSGP